jgi:ammonia channel protein AmtB
MMISSALVFLMVPGVALFNSGYSPKSSALTMLLLPLLTSSLLALQVRGCRF